EDWVDISTFSYDTAQVGFYRFNGKEKDPETGFLYYGARYHWPEVWSGWLSPDPMMDKYPGISPYAYCNWNPVIFVDPDGRDTFYIEMDKGRIYHQEAKGDHCIRFRKDGEILDDKTMTGIKSQINYEKSGTWDADGPGTTDYLEFCDAQIGKSVFDVITEESAFSRSAKEWDYYYFGGVGGELSSSGRNDKMIHEPDRYASENIIEWHHFHPNNTSQSWFPSYSDQENSCSLHVPSYLHNQGNIYRFDQVVRKRNVTPIDYRKKVTVY
ncbi:MAG: RHS repeat-associated core domain-containing protein, partial [bacterium P3]